MGDARRDTCNGPVGKIPSTPGDSLSISTTARHKRIRCCTRSLVHPLHPRLGEEHQILRRTGGLCPHTEVVLHPTRGRFIGDKRPRRNRDSIGPSERDRLSPNPPKGYGGGVDTGDDGYGKANRPGPVPIDGVEGSGWWPRQWPGGGRQWRRPAKTARRHAGSGTGGLGWHEFAGQPLGLSGGRVGRRRRAVRLAGEWRAIGPGRN